MDSVDRLLALDGHRLRAFKNKDNLICVEFDRCEVRSARFFRGHTGPGCRSKMLAIVIWRLFLVKHLCLMLVLQTKSA